MKVKTATCLFAALIFGLFVLFGGSLIGVTTLLDQEANDLARAGESISVAKQLRFYLLTNNRNDFFDGLDQTTNRLAENEILRRQTDGLLARMEMLVTSEKEGAILAELGTGIAAYLARLDLIEAADIPPLEQYREVNREVRKPLAVVDRLIEVNQSEMDLLVEAIDNLNRTADKIALLLLPMGGIVLLCLMGMMFFYIAHPLRVAAETISRFSAGAQARVQPKGLMEIRQIASNFNSMAERLDEKQKQQLHFIAAIAHDLRNPLNSMSMASELLDRKGHEEYRDLAGIISRQVKNLDRMVGDLLDTARIEAGQIDFKFSSHNINSLIMESIRLHRTGSDLHRFEVDLPADPLLSQCDGGRISQVMNNLLSNAIKYSPNGGRVTVKAGRVGEEIAISVTDEGIGIAPEDLNDIFKPFNRTAATRGTIPGIGLGLSASRRIIEGHGGKLMVKSELRSGSTFYFTLPLKPPHQGSPGSV